MTERKVLNKYFPPDFDPAKIPRLKGMKKEKIFSIRTMAPFNMMCLTCRGYIFKAKKFNSRMEECEFTYIDLKEYRFHIRCPSCCSEIIYRTDRENNDYVVESGAKRSFEAYTTAIRAAIKESVQEKEELEKNPIKALEKRTEESMNEFKISNKIQDLMERSRNDAPREEMIDDAIALVRRRNELTKMNEDREIEEIVQEQIKAQEKFDLERNKEKCDLIGFDEFRNKCSSNNNNNNNSWQNEKLQLLKDLVKLKRNGEHLNEQNNENVDNVKSIKLEGDDSQQSAEIDINKSDSQNTADNPLGLDYSSDCADE